MIENTPRPETEPRKQMKVRPPLILYQCGGAQAFINKLAAFYEAENNGQQE